MANTACVLIMILSSAQGGVRPLTWGPLSLNQTVYNGRWGDFQLVAGGFGNLPEHDITDRGEKDCTRGFLVMSVGLKIGGVLRKDMEQNKSCFHGLDFMKICSSDIFERKQPE